MLRGCLLCLFCLFWVGCITLGGGFSFCWVFTQGVVRLSVAKGVVCFCWLGVSGVYLSRCTAYWFPFRLFLVLVLLFYVSLLGVCCFCFPCFSFGCFVFFVCAFTLRLCLGFVVFYFVTIPLFGSCGFGGWVHNVGWGLGLGCCAWLWGFLCCVMGFR